MKNNTKNNYPFFSLETIVAGESVSNKISRLIEIMKKKKIDYNFISAGENVCWLLNLRGKDLPNSPIANCKIILTKDRKIYFFSSQEKIKKIKISYEKFKINFLKEDSILKCLIGLKDGNFCIDSKTCSVFEESLIGYKFKIVDTKFCTLSGAVESNILVLSVSLSLFRQISLFGLVNLYASLISSSCFSRAAFASLKVCFMISIDIID